MTATCSTCNDTHVMALFGNEVLCTRCPVPCDLCRQRPQGPYCASTPCLCGCHRASAGMQAPTPATIREHIELSRRASAGMPAELAAPHVALADLCLTYFAALDAADRCELTEEALTAAGERLDVAERQLREALGLDHPADEVACTGTTARWCPRCGDCTCGPHPADLDKPTCSLHGARSSHPAHPPSTVTPERVSDDPITSALRDVGAEHTPPPDWQHRVLKKVESSDVANARVARKEWNADDSARGESADYAEGWNDAVDAFERRAAASAQPNQVTLTFDRTELDRRLAAVERELFYSGRIADANRCLIARNTAHPHSAGEAAALLLGLPSPYPERASGDRSLTIGGAT